MSNHYHLLLETPEANLVLGMKWFQGTYTQRFNAMFHCRGHLFQGRYKAIPIQTDPLEGGLSYFRMVSTYIHLNPFRAGIAGEGCKQKLESYPWSSYPIYTGKKRRKPAWLETTKVLSTWGINGKMGTGRLYREKLERYMRFELDPDAGIRGEFEKQIKRGWYLGAEDFAVQLLEKLPAGTSDPGLEGTQKRTYDEQDAERILNLALPKLGFSNMDLTTVPNTQVEKQILAWLLKSQTTVPVQWIADRLGMGHRTSASRAISQIRTAKDRKTKRLKDELLQITG
jgi:hypothetical protein